MDEAIPFDPMVLPPTLDVIQYTRSSYYYNNVYVLHFAQIFISDNSYKHALTRRVKNCVDPNQLASEKPADLYLHCFQNRIYLGSAWQAIIIYISLVYCASIKELIGLKIIINLLERPVNTYS